MRMHAHALNVRQICVFVFVNREHTWAPWEIKQIYKGVVAKMPARYKSARYKRAALYQNG